LTNTNEIAHKSDGRRQNFMKKKSLIIMEKGWKTLGFHSISLSLSLSLSLFLFVILVLCGVFLPTELTIQPKSYKFRPTGPLTRSFYSLSSRWCAQSSREEKWKV